MSIGAAYTERTIDYTYDALSRLVEAEYSDVSSSYTYGYDLAGNLTNKNGTTRTFNAGNQMTSDGTNTLTYDSNGNLTNDGTNAYTWDRANRMLEVDNGTPADLTAYAYDGLNNRISQAIGTTSPVVTQYLLDTQAGLTKVIAQTTGGNTDRFIHTPHGIHATESASGEWTYALQDGLGSVRGVVDDGLRVDAVQSYDPYGNPDGSYGAGFGFTGEQTDSNGQVYLRARYYDPSLGIFPSLDPFEGMMDRVMSLNGYSWVEGNPVMNVDPSGQVIVDVWAAAFIEPESIQFPFGLDPFADWNGNGRSWHTLSDFGKPPLSSKTWWSLRFDTNDLSTLTSDAGTGETTVTFLGTNRSSILPGFFGVSTLYGQAPAPDLATVECTNSYPVGPLRISNVAISIEGNAKNPLIPIAPPIYIEYFILIMPQNGGINVRRDIDNYPWHELHIAVDGKSVVQLRQSPLEPSETPADLGLESTTSLFTFAGLFPPDGPCNQIRNPLPVPTPISVSLPDIDCIFE